MPPYPKPKRERLKRYSLSWEKRVDELYERENHFCQGCGKWLFRNEASPHHIKSTRAGGGDELLNLYLCCSGCHTKIHSGELIIE